MKVLQICYKPPYPPVDGGTVGMHCITKGLLADGHNVKVLSVFSDKHPVRYKSMDDDYRSATRFEAEYIDLSIHPLDAAVSLLCGESYNVKRFESKSFANKIIDVLSKDTFDIIQVESIFLAPYVPVIRSHTNTPIVMRAHNVEYMIWRKLALSTSSPLKRWYIKKLALSLRAYELEHVNDFDGIVCVTDLDADTFRREGCRRPIMVRPFGIDPKPAINTNVEPYSLFHIAAMDWQPNLDGVNWFLDKVWPLIHNKLPQVNLYLAGRKMPETLLTLKLDGVHVVGEVPDAFEFMASKQINIVPLLAGSGIRVKIIEAMSIGKPVISTTIGAEGIKYTDGKDILIANTPEEFMHQIERCLNTPQLLEHIGSNAHSLAMKEYDNNALSKRLVDFYNKIIEKTLSES